ncbi:MAG: peptidoglycan DD-metalloendopeptidase family protein [Paludibacteraceae bacterium]|nr:peptidoglycan DD-metalloendopeptidase family protein [Paludibacteraceae bacterium]
MKKRFLLFLLALQVVLPIVSQTVSELEDRRKRALKELEITSSLISKTAEQKKTSLSQIGVLRVEINARQSLINVMNAEVNNINRNINQLRSEAKQKQTELNKLKVEYGKLMYHSYYKKTKYESLMFILSANSFAESYRRYRYVQQYAEFAKGKVSEIEAVKADLEKKLAEIEKARLSKVAVLNERKQENSRLQTERNKQNALVSQLSRKEKDLRKELKKQEANANAINRRIDQLIAEEARKSQKAQTAGTQEYALTKEQQLLSGGFEKNQGRLPWPVERGIIVGRFGVHAHPVLKHVTTDNKGIYLQTTPQSDARAVFDGEVTQRFSIPGSNYTVIVRHGNYRTVYSNLTNVYVKVGDNIKARQAIGRIFVDTEDNNKSELYFQVWKERDIQNPENWITR